MTQEVQEGYIANALLFNKIGEASTNKSPQNDLASRDYLELYKDIDFLKTFITKGRARILPRRLTGLSKKAQRKITKAIKIARILGLLPFASTVN
jgi:ribosomal protein S18